MALAALSACRWGILFDRFGWQSVFWVSAGVGVAIGVAVLLVVSESKVKTRGRFDVLGAILLSIALTALLLVISKGGSWGWASEQTILLVVVTAGRPRVLGPLFAEGQPAAGRSTYRRAAILLTNIASILVGFALMANMLISTQQLQQPAAARRVQPRRVAAGLAMVPRAWPWWRSRRCPGP